MKMPEDREVLRFEDDKRTIWTGLGRGCLVTGRPEGKGYSAVLTQLPGVARTIIIIISYHIVHLQSYETDSDSNGVGALASPAHYCAAGLEHTYNTRYILSSSNGVFAEAHCGSPVGNIYAMQEEIQSTVVTLHISEHRRSGSRRSESDTGRALRSTGEARRYGDMEI
jgi:hypothetical protein